MTKVPRFPHPNNFTFNHHLSGTMSSICALQMETARSYCICSPQKPFSMGKSGNNQTHTRQDALGHPQRVSDQPAHQTPKRSGKKKVPALRLSCICKCNWDKLRDHQDQASLFPPCQFCPLAHPRNAWKKTTGLPQYDISLDSIHHLLHCLLEGHQSVFWCQLWGGEKKNNERLVRSGKVYEAVSVRVLGWRFRDIRKPKLSCFADYVVASYTGAPASPRQNCILLRCEDDRYTWLHWWSCSPRELNAELSQDLQCQKPS